MAEQPYRNRRSLTPGNVPAPGSLQEGQLAINIPDQLTWVGDDSGNPVFITSWDGVANKPATFPPDPHTHVESEITNLNRLRWIGHYSSGQTGFLRNDVIYDEGWLMACLNDTNDRPAPQPSGIFEWATEIPGPLNLALQTPVAVPSWITGNRFTIINPLALAGYRWYCPDISGDFQYSVWLGVNSVGGGAPDVSQLLAPSIPSFVGWQSIPSSAIIAPGVILDLAVVTSPTALPNVIAAVWDVENRNGNPGTGTAFMQNSGTEMRINKTPKTGDATGLDTVTEGGTMSYGGSTWTITSVTDSGAQMWFGVTPNQGRPDEGEYTIQFEWGAALPVPYVRDDDHYDFAFEEGTAEGFESTEYPPQVLNLNAYGVDLNLDILIDSPDWEEMMLPPGTITGGTGSSTGVK